MQYAHQYNWVLAQLSFLLHKLLLAIVVVAAQTKQRSSNYSTDQNISILQAYFHVSTHSTASSV